MDFANRRAVDFCLRLADASKYALCQVLLRRRQNTAGIDLLGDVVQMPVSVLRLVLDSHLHGPKAVAFDLLAGQSNVEETERIDARLNSGQLNAAIDERPQRHVAAD